MTAVASFKRKGNETGDVRHRAPGERVCDGDDGKVHEHVQDRERGGAPGWKDWAVADNGYPNFNYDLNENGKTVHYGAAPGDYMTDVMSRLGQAFVKEHASAAFLLEIATFTPHAPFTPAPRDAISFPG